jgi:hypothetical protein
VNSRIVDDLFNFLSFQLEVVVEHLADFSSSQSRVNFPQIMSKVALEPGKIVCLVMQHARVYCNKCLRRKLALQCLNQNICSSPMTQLIADASFAHQFMQDEGNPNHCEIILYTYVVKPECPTMLKNFLPTFK